MPKTYEQDGLQNRAYAFLHYFYGDMDFYITEKDSVKGEPQNQAYGYFTNGYESEMTYVSIQELIETNKVELDFFFTPQPLYIIKEENMVFNLDKSATNKLAKVQLILNKLGYNDVDFVEYVNMFYGIDAVKQAIAENGKSSYGLKVGFTKKEIRDAFNQYMAKPTWEWGDGDSVDRENLFNNYLLPLYQKKYGKESIDDENTYILKKRYVLIKSRTSKIYPKYIEIIKNLLNIKY